MCACVHVCMPLSFSRFVFWSIDHLAVEGGRCMPNEMRTSLLGSLDLPSRSSSRYATWRCRKTHVCVFKCQCCLFFSGTYITCCSFRKNTEEIDMALSPLVDAFRRYRWQRRNSVRTRLPEKCENLGSGVCFNEGKWTSWEVGSG